MVTALGTEARSRRTTGVTFVEVLVGLAVAAAAGGALMLLSRTGVQTAQRAEEVQLAASVGARLIDRMVADGYRNLAAQPRKSGPMDLAVLRNPAEPTPVTTGQYASDGLVFSASYALSERVAGLLAVEVTVTWEPGGGATGLKPGQLYLLRYVGSPSVAVDSREAFP